jgi:hypothetical protein
MAAPCELPARTAGGQAAGQPGGRRDGLPAGGRATWGPPVAPTQVVAALGDYDGDGAVADPEILGRLDRLAQELVAFTAATRPVRDQLIARYA